MVNYATLPKRIVDIHRDDELFLAAREEHLSKKRENWVPINELTQRLTERQPEIIRYGKKIKVFYH